MLPAAQAAAAERVLPSLTHLRLRSASAILQAQLQQAAEAAQITAAEAQHQRQQPSTNEA
jgi:hypothetical protein